MCLSRLSPKRLSSPSTALPLARESAVSFWKHPCYFSADPHRWMFPSFFADALRAAHHLLFPPRDLIFPKLFGTESPEDVTGERRPLSVIAVSAQHTCQDTSVTAFFLGCLPLLSGFGTHSQSLASAWECWGHRPVSLRSAAASGFTVLLREGESIT